MGTALIITDVSAAFIIVVSPFYESASEIVEVLGIIAVVIHCFLLLWVTVSSSAQVNFGVPQGPVFIFYCTCFL